MAARHFYGLTIWPTSTTSTARMSFNPTTTSRPLISCLLRIPPPPTRTTNLFSSTKRYLSICVHQQHQQQQRCRQNNHLHLCRLIVARQFSDVPPEKPKLSLADEILSSKIASEKAAGEEKQGTDNTSGDGGEKAKEPMPNWKKYGYTFGFVLMGGSLLANAILFSLPDQDEQGNTVEDEFSSLPFPSQHLSRLKNKIFTTKKAIEEPFSDKLLPDPFEPPYYQPKYTIVLELTGLLVNSTWSHKHGWRFQKRPGLDMFLSQIGFPTFEVVLWTVENSMTFHPIVSGMDPQNQHIIYRQGNM